jgi:hypothetical protein
MNSVKKSPTPNLPVPGVVAANGSGGDSADTPASAQRGERLCARLCIQEGARMPYQQQAGRRTGRNRSGNTHEPSGG